MNSFFSSPMTRRAWLLLLVLLATASRTWAQGAALHFDGTDDYVEIATSTSLDSYTTTGEFTLEYWIKPQFSGATVNILSKRPASNDAGFLVEYYAGTIGHLVYTSGGWHSVAGTYTPNVWQHVSITAKNNDFLTLYINGALISSVPLFGTMVQSPSVLRVMANSMALDRYTDGSMDELRIWNRVLTPCEIQHNWTCELSGTQTGLAAYYPFNEMSGTSLADASGNGNAGMLAGFALSGTTSNWISGGGVTTGVSCAALAAAVSISASPAGSITVGNSVTFTATPTLGGSSPAYVWKNNGNVISGETSSTYTTTSLANGDVITCEITSNDPCASPATATSNSITMTVTPAPLNGPSCGTYINHTTANGLVDNMLTGVCVSGNMRYVATMNGLSISANGGATYTTRNAANSGLAHNMVWGVYAVGNTLYASTQNGLSISADGGATFTTRSTANGLGNNALNAVTVNGNTVYAATAGGLSISTDGGASFTNYTTANGLSNNMIIDVKVAGNVIYAATGAGICISANGGASFVVRTMADGLGSNVVNKIFVNGSTVYAATNDGLSISTDGGVSFVSHNIVGGLGQDYLYDVYAVGSTVYVATEFGLFISTNAGTTFSRYTTANGLGNDVVFALYATPDAVYAATTNGLSFCSIYTPPTAFNMTGGGSYCSCYGVGVAVGLDGSEVGVNYQLYFNNAPVGSAVPGSGSAISFGNQTVNGTYIAVASSINSFALMTGSATVSPVQEIRYVKPVASGTGDGSSWANASASLHNMIVKPLAGACPAEVWVAAGTYKPTNRHPNQSIGSGSINYSIPLLDKVFLYGGFAGAETERSQRNPNTNVTTLSGDVGTPGLSTDNCFHVVMGLFTNTTAQTLIDGFSITGGYANGGAFFYDATAQTGSFGGGIYLHKGSNTLNNLKIQQNYAYRRGAGLYTQNGINQITNCFWKGNQSGNGSANSYGGGICSSNSSNTIKNSILYNNIASAGGTAIATQGGGIYTSGGTQTWDQLVLYGNESSNGFGGGIYIESNSTTMTNSTVVANKGIASQGGIYYGCSNRCCKK